MNIVKATFHPVRRARRTITLLALPGLLLVAGASTAAGPAPADADGPGANAAIEQRVRAELQSVVSGLIESGALDAAQARDLHLDVDSPAQQVTNLGLLVDGARGDRDGVHVLAVTPGSAAEKIGVRSGDVLVSVDDQPLAGVDGAAAVLKGRIDRVVGQDTITFGVRRDGRMETLHGMLSSVYVPAMHLTIGSAIAASAMAASADTASATGGCGRISDFDVAPRQQGLHGAKIISIDGVAPGPQGSRAFRVDAGRHVVKVAEQIEAKYLPFNDRLRNAGLSESRYKTIDVDVAPDTTSLIAVRLVEDQRNQPKNGAYWEPVAWKQVAETCR